MLTSDFWNQWATTSHADLERDSSTRQKKLEQKLTNYSCNCMYGSQDSRCCIARAQRALLEEAHRLGREGKPLPPVKDPPTTNWGNISCDTKTSAKPS